jgi:hypothetical protein
VTTRPKAVSSTRPSAFARPTGRQVAGGFGALGVLVIGLAGIPILLATVVGWPLPHHVPTGNAVTHAFGASIPDSFWPRMFAVLAWLAWAYFVVSVVVSLVRQLRGRTTGHRSHLLGSSAMAALVAAALILGQLRGGFTAAGKVHTGPPADLVPMVQLLSETTSEVPTSMLTGSAQSTSQPAVVIHTVMPGDTLWGLAVRYYGDGEQWPTIFQANVGLPQPGGGALTDAHWIYPGWSLTIPAATQAPSVAPSTAPPLQAPAPAISSTAPTVTSPAEVAPPSSSGASNSGRSSASAAVGVGSRPKGTARAPGKPTASQRPSNPRSPLRQHTDPTVPGGATPSRLPLTLHHSSDAPTNHDERPNTGAKVHPSAPHPPGSDVGPMAVGAGLFGLTAIGLVTALDWRRRRQLGRRSFGGRISRPEPKSPLADLELQLRHYARAGQVFWLCHLPELLGRAADLAAVAPPEVLGVELIHDGLDVLVTGDSGEPLAPFTRRPGHPNVWHLPFTIDPGIVDEAAAASSVPLALATVSHGAAGAVLVNVSQYRSIHLTVSAEQVEGVLAAIATELASTTAPVGTEVIAVGFGYGVVDRLDGGIVVDDLDRIAALLRPDQEAIVLLGFRATEDEILDALRDQDHVHLVTAGPLVPSNTVLVLDPKHPTLEDHFFDSATPAHVSDESLEAVQALFELAEEIPGDTAHGSGEASGVHLSGAKGPVGEVMIGVLGELMITVDGGDPQDLVAAVSTTAGTKAGRVAELLTYLAAHDGTATRGGWLTDVSPEKALSDGYVRNLVLLARRSLAAVTGDPDLLSYDKATQRLSMDEKVTTDWKQFQSVISAGDLAGLRKALELVRGTPFGVAPPPWTSAGGIYYVVGDAITDTALKLGELALDDGDRLLAAWAARQGQLANRYDQGLWRVLIRAATDEPARRQIWRELYAVLAVDGDPTAELEPATVALYDWFDTPERTAADILVLGDDDEAVIPTRRAV